MDKNSNIQNNVEETLNSFEGVSSASPGPYFFTHVQARLNRVEKNIWESISAFIARPTIAIAMVSGILLMNTVAVLQHRESSKFTVDQSDQSVYEELNVAVNSFYDYEIKEP